MQICLAGILVIVLFEILSSDFSHGKSIPRDTTIVLTASDDGEKLLEKEFTEHMKNVYRRDSCLNKRKHKLTVMCQLGSYSGITYTLCDCLQELNKTAISKSQMFKKGNCLACTLVIKYQMKRMKNGNSAEEALKWSQKMCEIFGLETPRVCRGGIEIFGKQAIAVLKQVTMTPQEICSLTFPEQCSLKSFKTKTGQWRVKLPDYPKGRKMTSIREEIGGKEVPILKVLHLTDVHIDTEYQYGTEALCNEPLCCRKLTEESSRVYKILGNWTREAYDMASVFSPKNATKRQPPPKSGKWGDYRECDLPTYTLENLLKTVSLGMVDEKFVGDPGKSSRKIDYIIFTGDIPAHDVWAQNRSTQITLLNYMTSILLKYFPTTPVYPAVGNHDSFPSNNFPVSNSKATDSYSVQWFYDALAGAWSPWLPEEALKTVQLGAYYSVLIQPGLRLVSLNTNFCYSENWWIYLHPEDPAGMLKWFVKILQQAEINGEKVHVIGHVPPGRSPDCLSEWSENYYKILERFTDTITAQYFGHTHFDEFQLFYSDDNGQSPFSVAYLGPSATPYVDMNPGFRIYDVTGFHSRWETVNHRTYVLDLNEANKSGIPRWNLEYDALSAFNMSSLKPHEWGNLVREWKNYFSTKKGGPPKSLVNYVNYYSKGRMFTSMKGDQERKFENTNSPCKSIICAKEIVCNIVKNVQWNFC